MVMEYVQWPKSPDRTSANLKVRIPVNMLDTY